MLLKLLSGFRDPVRRPRYIVWSFVILLGLAMFMVVALGATSTRWFCEEVCHKVQDDTIFAYQKSAHAEISCMACHEPVNANTMVFMFAKVKALGELYLAATNTYELPLNRGSALSLNEEEMGSKQCTQCHSPNRSITPHKGLLIDHAKHEQAGVWCTVCHNRTAHNEEAAPPKLIAPNGKKNIGHPNYMKMDACFRCHDLEGKVKMTGEGAKAAPGTCATCHEKDFDLVPASHKTGDWKKKHGEAARETAAEVEEQKTEAGELVKEGAPDYLVAPVNTCQTCHKKDFCTTCHGGVAMPHPKDFVKGHKDAASKNLAACAKCHAADGEATPVTPGNQPAFCQDCHHKGRNAGVNWLNDHKRLVEANGAYGCFKCHAPTICAKCHVNGGTLNGAPTTK